MSDYLPEQSISDIFTRLPVKYLPEQIISDIFTRLPVKTLLQIRYACKSWYYLINSPYFITAHINRTIAHNTTPPLLFLRYLADIHDFGGHFSVHYDDENFDLCKSFKLAFEHYRTSSIRKVGSCNGLICLSGDGTHESTAYWTKIIILWNPAIDKSVILRTASDSHDCNIFGFGFDSRTNDYKVVRIAYDLDRRSDYAGPSEVDVYELSTGLWRRSHGSAPPSPFHMNLCGWSHVFVNGASHWIAFEKRGKKKFGYLILSFDMGSEDFKEMKLPGSVVGVDGRELHLDLSVALFGESLSLFHYDDAFSRGGSCCIWVMKEYGIVSSWTKLFTVDLGGTMNKVLGFRKTGEVLVYKRFRELVSYDPKSNKVVDAGIGRYESSIQMDTYMESLVLLGRKKRSQS